MASKKLRRVGLSEDILQRCESKKIVTCKDFLSLSELELINLLDIPWKVVKDIANLVSESVAPASTTVSPSLSPVMLLSYPMDANIPI